MPMRTRITTTTGTSNEAPKARHIDITKSR